MKKLLALLLAAMLCFCLIACSSDAPEGNDDKKETKEEPKADEPAKNDGEDKEVINDEEYVDDKGEYSVEDINELLYYSAVVMDTELEYGVCAECGDSVDPNYVICDDCADAEDVCAVCEEELDSSDYMMHQDCAAEFEVVLAELLAE